VSYIDENQFENNEKEDADIMNASISIDYQAKHMLSNQKSPAHKRDYTSRNTPNMFDKAQISSVRQSIARDLELNEDEVAAYLAKQRTGMGSRASKGSRQGHQSPTKNLKRSLVFAHGS
jgi:hypothetical protein